MKSPSIIALFMLICPATTSAGVVVISADRDTSIYSESTTNPDGNHSSGGSISLFAGRIFPATDERRALLAFDVASAVPAGATIDNVELALTIFRNSIRDAQPNDEFSLHRLTCHWGEGTVTPDPLDGHGDPASDGDAPWFSNAHNSSLWATPGGDFEPAPSATSAIGGLVNNTGDSLLVVWSGLGMVDDVQQWLDDPNGNFGWILAAAASNGEKSARIFGSRERSSGIPQLRIEFAPVPAPSSGVLTLVAILPTAGLRRQSSCRW